MSPLHGTRGWRACSRRYVIVLDADDRLAPGALEALRRPLDADPQLGFAYGRMRFFGDWDGRASLSAVRPVRPALPAHDRAQRRSLGARSSRRPEGSTPSSSSSRTGSTGSTRSPMAGRASRSTPSPSNTGGTRARSTRATGPSTARRSAGCGRSMPTCTRSPPEAASSRSRPALAPRLLGPPAGSGPPGGRFAPPFLAKSRLSKPFLPADTGHMRKAAVVPAFNEAGSIAEVVAEIRYADADFEVIVVDDGSTDGTAGARARGRRNRASRFPTTSASAPRSRRASSTRTPATSTSPSRSTATASTTRPTWRSCSSP